MERTQWATTLCNEDGGVMIGCYRKEINKHNELD